MTVALRWIPPVLHGKALKGHEHLIRAAPIVLDEFPHTKFLLVGNGWEEGGRQQMERMRALTIELGLEDSVIFTGFRTDVPRIYRDLDISVQPSLNENLGGTIESLLMERPTIVTRVGGLIDSVAAGSRYILGPQDETARSAHSVARIRGKVQDRGAELDGVDLARPNLVLQLERDVDALADGLLAQHQILAQQITEADDLRPDLLPTREGEEVLSQPRASRGGP